MSLPSERTLAREFGPEAGKKLRRLLDGRDDPEGYETVKRWVRQCYNRPSSAELILEACNEVLEGFGTEAIWGEESCVEPAAVYVNKGDTYAATLLQDSDGRWFVTSWGDWVESMERKGTRFP